MTATVKKNSSSGLRVAVTQLLLFFFLTGGLIATPAATSADAPRVKVLALFRDQAMVDINGKQIQLKAGGAAYAGVKLIKSNAQEAVLEINGERGKYSLGSQVSVQLATPQSTIVRIPSRRGMFFTSGLINGRSVRFLVDTGASAVAMARPTADRLQIQYRQYGVPVAVSTATQADRGWRVKLNSVNVGGIELTQVEGIVMDTDYEQEILLGMSFLGRLKFRQEQGLVVLEADTK